MSNIVILILACCAIVLLFLALRLFFRMLNRVGSRQREELIRQGVASETDEAVRKNVEQQILLQKQLSQDTNTVQNERRS